MAQPFVIDGICRPYNFSEENLRGRFGRVFNDVPYAFHPLLNPPGASRRKPVAELPESRGATGSTRRQ